MTLANQDAGNATIFQAEHDSTGGVANKKVQLYGWDVSGMQKVKVAVDAAGVLQTSATVTVTSGTSFNQFDQDDAVVSAVDTEILSYTVPANKTANIKGFLGTGTATGKFTLKVDGATVSVLRTSAANRNGENYFGDGAITVTTGKVITINVYHEETTNQSMAANVFGTLT